MIAELQVVADPTRKSEFTIQYDLELTEDQLFVALRLVAEQCLAFIDERHAERNGQ